MNDLEELKEKFRYSKERMKTLLDEENTLNIEISLLEHRIDPGKVSKRDFDQIMRLSRKFGEIQNRARDNQNRIATKAREDQTEVGQEISELYRQIMEQQGIKADAPALGTDIAPDNPAPPEPD